MPPLSVIWPSFINCARRSGISMAPESLMWKVPARVRTGMPLWLAACGFSLRKSSEPSSAMSLPLSRFGCTRRLNTKSACGRFGMNARGLMFWPWISTCSISWPRCSVNGRIWVLACRPTPLPVKSVFSWICCRLPDAFNVLSTAMPSSSPLDSSLPFRAKGDWVCRLTCPLVVAQ